MKNLTRIAFVLALAACGNGNNNIPDPCETDPTLPECQTPQACIDDADCDPTAQNCFTGVCLAGACEIDPTCGSVPVGTPTAELSMSLNPNGSAFFDGLYQDDQAFTDFFAGELAADESIAIGACVDVPPPTGGPAIAGKSMGNVQVSKGATQLVDMVQQANGSYEALSAIGTVDLGNTLDVVLTGSGVVATASLDGALVVPAALPSLTDTVNGNGQITLATVIHYAALAVDFLKVRFSFIGPGNTIVTIVCRLDPAGTSITIPQATFDRLPQSGQIFIDGFNRTRKALQATDGVARTMVSTVNVGGSKGYVKP